MNHARSLSTAPDYPPRRAIAASLAAVAFAAALYFGTIGVLAALIALGWHA